MQIRTKGVISPHPSLRQLCARVIDLSIAYDEVSEEIENRAYQLTSEGKLDKAITVLSALSVFFEQLPTKNEEQIRDLADVYILIGEINQLAGCFEQSIPWFEKAIIVEDRYSLPYHDLATSFFETGDIRNAIRCLTQEITVAPGNYYTYFRLADLYALQGQDSMVEECFRKVLERDPENIQALHRLMAFYTCKDPAAEIHLLRKKLITVSDRKLNELETIIRAYHMCQDRLCEQVLNELDARSAVSPELTVVHLIKAHIYGLLGDFSKKKNELLVFKHENHGRDEFMKHKLKEFGDIFGVEAVDKLGKRLLLAHPRGAKGRE